MDDDENLYIGEGAKVHNDKWDDPVQKKLYEYTKNNPGLGWDDNYIPAEQLLKIYERENLTELADKIAQFQNFVTPSNYWYKKEELLSLLQEYRAYLKRNEEHILKTGFPRTKFNLSEWVDFSYTNTFPIKLPLTISLSMESVYEVPWESKMVEKLNQYENPTYLYYWIKEDVYAMNIDNLDYSDGESFFMGFDMVDYTDSPYLPFFTKEEINKIEALRSTLVSLKCLFLDIIIDKIERQDFNILEEVIAVFTDTIDYDDFIFLLEMDWRLLEKEIDSYVGNFHEAAGLQYLADDYEEDIGSKSKHNYIDRPVLWNLTGGIRGMFFFIAYIEKELQIQRIDIVKRTIENIFPLSKNFEKRNEQNMAIGVLDDGKVLKSYYQVLVHPKKKEFDELLELDKRLASKEKDFWKKRSFKISQILENELKQKYKISVRIKKKYERKFFTYIEKFIETQIEYLNLYGDVPQLHPSVPAEKDKFEPKDEVLYLFTDAGGGFRFRFGSPKDYWIQKYTGLKYIYYLLNNPNTTVPVQKFTTAGKTNKSAIVSSEDGLFIEGDLQPLLTEETFRDILQKIRDLKEEKDEADSFNDFKKSEKLAKDIYELETYLYDKKHSFVEKELDKQKRAVRAAVTDAIGRIRKVHREFALHLDRNIDIKEDCIYTNDPANKIKWIFSDI